jgi:hypothetical protein
VGQAVQPQDDHAGAFVRNHWRNVAGKAAIG